MGTFVRFYFADYIYFYPKTSAFYGQILTTICFSVPAGVDILIAIFATLLVLRERTATNFAA